MTTTIASLMFVAGAAVAADPTPVSVSGGTLHFEGKRVNAACAVSTKSADQTVTLGQYRTTSFTAIGDTIAQVPFTIVLNDCDPKVVATAAVAFSGQADNPNNNLLVVSSADNSTAADTTPPSAYYLMLVNNSVGAKKIDNVMIASKSDMQILFPAGAEVAFDFASMRLNISLPQASMLNSARGYIPPEKTILVHLVSNWNKSH